MNGAHCTRPPDDAALYHLGELDAAARVEFAAHLAVCPRCAARVRAQQRLDDGLARLPQYRAPSPLVEFPAPGQPRRRAATGWSIAVAAAVATLLLGLVAVRSEIARREARDVALVYTARAADARALLLPRAAEAASFEHLPPWLGFVTCADWIVSDPDGVPICALAPAGPLGRVGVRAGDVLLAVGGRSVATDSAMYRALLRRRPGDEIAVTVRDATGATRSFTARLEARQFGARHPFDMEWSPALVASLDQVPPGGVDLTEVFRREPATTTAPAGLRVAFEPTPEQMRHTVLSPIPYFFGGDRVRAADVIVRFGDEPVTTLGELMVAAMNVQRRDFTIEVRREGVPVTISIPRSG